MSLYRKKPLVIEAIQLRRDNIEEIKEFTEGKAFDFTAERCINGKFYCKINTFEGITTAMEYDYICKGIKGELYPCKPYVFENTYEEVGQQDK